MAEVTTDRLTIGVDVGDRHSHLVVLDAEGTVLEESRLPTNEAAFRKRFESCQSAKVAIEAGAHSPWLSRLLEGLGHEVLVANPRKVRSIFTNDSKNDRNDAEQLARLARMDPRLLSPIRHRGKQSQQDLAVIRARDILVQSRTQLINHVRGAVKSFGKQLPKHSSAAFARKVPGDIPEELLVAMTPLLETIQGLTDQIRGCDARVKEMAEKSYPEAGLLSQIPGIGPLTSVSYVLTLEDPKRFKNSRSVGSYLGLRPRQKESGEREPQLRITKAGDVFVRRLLVGSAHRILGPFGPDCDLRRWGLELAKRGGRSAKKRAVVAVARKLAVLMHRIWTTGEVYEPLRNASKRAA